MNETQLLLKELTEAYGVSGAEHEIRGIMAKYLAPHGTLTNDKMGSLVCETNGAGPRVLMMAHMDEIGFVVRHITKEGFLKRARKGLEDLETDYFDCMMLHMPERPLDWGFVLHWGAPTALSSMPWSALKSLYRTP